MIMPGPGTRLWPKEVAVANSAEGCGAGGESGV